MVSRTRPQVLAAVPTAFSPRGEVDLGRTRSLARFLGQAGVDGLFVCGTAGEFPALAPEERRSIAQAVLEEVGETTRVVLHAGAASLHEVGRLLADARTLGITDVAVITPYFLPGDPASLREFFAGVSSLSTGLRTYLYLYRAVCGSYLAPGELAELASLPHLVGAKISGEPPATIADFVQTTPTDFEIYAGADQELVPMAEAGSLGLVSAMASALPKPFLALARAWELGDREATASWQAAVDDVCGVLQGQIPRTRYALALQGVEVGPARMALPGLAGVEPEIARIVDAYS